MAAVAVALPVHFLGSRACGGKKCALPSVVTFRLRSTSFQNTIFVDQQSFAQVKPEILLINNFFGGSPFSFFPRPDQTFVDQQKSRFHPAPIFVDQQKFRVSAIKLSGAQTAPGHVLTIGGCTGSSGAMPVQCQKKYNRCLASLIASWPGLVA